VFFSLSFLISKFVVGQVCIIGGQVKIFRTCLTGQVGIFEVVDPCYPKLDLNLVEITVTFRNGAMHI